MNINKLKTLRRSRRRAGIRKRIQGTAQTPRLSIYRSGKHMYAQIIDDIAGTTLVAASTTQDKIASGGNIAAATQVGKAIAEKARSAGVASVAFDRGGFNYHGRVKALAEAAREAGLKF